MQPDTVLTLGDFEFSRYEIPSHIPFGGDQRLATHDLVGGGRVVDALGRSDAEVEWSGLFTGQSALDRARYLDGLRVAGKPLTLSWDMMLYTVVIASFRADYERFYQIPYRITCTVVADLNARQTQIVDAGMDAALREDVATATDAVAVVADAPLSAQMSTLNTAIAAVSNLASASQSTINGILAPLADVQARVQLLIASTANMISNIATLGGILPNNPIAQQAASLTGQIVSMAGAAQLYNLQAILGRIGTNLGLIGTGTRTVTTAGGNLYGMAAENYGDATAWTAIAAANGIADPQLNGVNTLVIPPVYDTSGGVLNA